VLFPGVATETGEICQDVRRSSCASEEGLRIDYSGSERLILGQTALSGVP
jgi:hypothetical protein